MGLSYSFQASARWTSARNGRVKAESAVPAIDFGAPPEFQGASGQWTPEHFLLSAVAACFITTFRAIAELSKFDSEGLEVAAEGLVAKAENGLRFTHILIRPTLRIRSDAERERALRLLEKAEHSCLISRSLRSEVRMEPEVQALNAAQTPAHSM